MRFSADIVCPSVLTLSNLTQHKACEGDSNFILGKALTGFQTTHPWIERGAQCVISHKHGVRISVKQGAPDVVSNTLSFWSPPQRQIIKT